MLLAVVRRRTRRLPGLANASFSTRWQSSKVPVTAKARTFPPQAVSCFSCRPETPPFG